MLGMAETRQGLNGPWGYQWEGGTFGCGEGRETDYHTGKPTQVRQSLQHLALKIRRAKFHEFLQQWDLRPVILKMIMVGSEQEGKGN